MRVAPAQFNLGVMFARGEGVDKDVSQAGRWFTEAANNNNPAIAEQAEAALDSLSGRRRRRCGLSRARCNVHDALRRA